MRWGRGQSPVALIREEVTVATVFRIGTVRQTTLRLELLFLMALPSPVIQGEMTQIILVLQIKVESSETR